MYYYCSVKTKRGCFMIKKIIALVMAAFCVGLGAGMLFNSASAGMQSPAPEAVVQAANGAQTSRITATLERDSPFDRIKEDQILVYPDRVVIDLKNAEWSTFTDTNSMDPVLDAGTNAIQIVPKSPADIHIGDIASYETEYGIIIHRVVDIGYDENGWYAVFKGDNNALPDPAKVRFEQIKRVVVALIY